MPYAVLKVTPEWFTEMLKAVKEGETRRYDVIENGLPEDAQVISVSTHWENELATLFILLESETFSELNELERPLLDPPRFRIYHDDPVSSDEPQA